MEIRLHKVAISLLAGAVTLGVVGLGYQYFEIRALRLQMKEQQATLESASRSAASALARLEVQDSRIRELERVVEQTARKAGFPSVEKLDALQPGYYRLTTSTRYDPETDAMSPYTITHVVVELHYETWETKLHVGMARSGMTPSGVYFDYDNDGEVDVDMAVDFIRDIPVFGRSLAKTYDPVVAQSLYTIFVNEAGNAEFTSIEDLSRDAEAASGYLWMFVDSQYRAMKAWVLENLPDRQKQQ